MPEIPQPQSFVGRRLYLRTLTPDDATAAYCSWLNDPAVNHYLTTKHCTIPELKEYIKSRNSQLNAIFYGIFLNGADKHIGTIKLQDIGTRNDLAILIGDKRSWGQGYAGEAMQLLIDYGFRILGLRQITLGVIGQNLSAIKAYTKLGFKEVNREYGTERFGNEVLDQVSMVLTRPSP